MIMGRVQENVGSLTRLLLLAVALTGASYPADAAGNPRACRQLESQLASLSTAKPTNVRRYDDAIARQQQQMQKAREQARRAGCGHAVTASAIAFCANVNSTLGRMEQNLASLQKKRGGTDNRDTRRERARLQAAINQNGCRAGKSTAAQDTAAPTSSSTPPNNPQTGSRYNARGNYRTMCVRTCDGFYFPISNSAPQSAFAQDERACQAMCPGTEVELYIHRLPGQESEDMVSASTGLPYKRMSTAFLYRKQNASTSASCSCSPTTNATASAFQVIGGEYANRPETTPGQNSTPSSIVAIPKPGSRPDPADDPETLASREGGLDVETLKRLSTPTPSPVFTNQDANPDGERTIRVVGPEFLPDPEAAIDLRVQVPAHAR